MFRPETKIIDCTIRDGGLMNDWRFTKAMVKDVFDGLAKAGVDYVELGYRADKAQFSVADFGPWRFSSEEDLRQVAYECATKVAVMVDVGRVDYADFIPASESIIKMFRVATYVKDIDKAIHLGRHIKSLGYEISVNIMAVSHALEPEIDQALDQLAATDFEAVYLVDSFGYLYSEPIHYLAEKYLRRLPGKQIGIHCHNNQQLAFSNTIDALVKGINFADATIYGIGRAAGNCPLELLIGFLKNPKFDARPILDLIEKYFLDLHKELRWGYEIPYAITGILNKHPRAAMAFMKGHQGNSLREFYNQLQNVEGE